MRMGRKAAILMLASVVLWAAVPVIVSLTPMTCHSCCQAMAMECDAAATNAAHACCRLEIPESAAPAAGAVAPEFQIGPVRAPVSHVAFEPGDLAGQTPGSSEAPPPRSLLGASTILRI